MHTSQTSLPGSRWACAPRTPLLSKAWAGWVLSLSSGDSKAHEQPSTVLSATFCWASASHRRVGAQPERLRLLPGLRCYLEL